MEVRGAVALFRAWKAGSESAFAPLCELMMEPVRRIAYTKGAAKDPEVLSEAYAKMVETLRKARHLAHDNIVGHVCVRVAYHLDDYRMSNRLVATPPSMVRKGAKRHNQSHVVGERPTDDDATIAPTYHSVLARPETPSPEFREIMEKLARDARDSKVMAMMAVGNSRHDVAKSIGVTDERVAQILARLEARYKLLWGSDK